MADPLLAMIGAITLFVLGVMAIVSITVIAVRLGLALARAIWAALCWLWPDGFG